MAFQMVHEFDCLIAGAHSSSGSKSCLKISQIMRSSRTHLCLGSTAQTAAAAADQDRRNTEKPNDAIWA